MVALLQEIRAREKYLWHTALICGAQLHGTIDLVMTILILALSAFILSWWERIEGERGKSTY